MRSSKREVLPLLLKNAPIAPMFTFPTKDNFGVGGAMIVLTHKAMTCF